MNAREHYIEAERLINAAFQAADLMSGKEVEFHQGKADRENIANACAMAQVHATLALFDGVREIGDHLDSLPRTRGGAA